VAHPISGRLLLNADYAVACIRMKLPLLVYYPPAKDADPLVQALSGDYGIYDASQVSSTPYVQNVVQPDRLRVNNGKTAKQTHSATWRTVALPRLKPGMRVCDFGAGNADYAKRLRKQGAAIDWYEPFYMDRSNKGGDGSVFDVKGSVTQQREIAQRVEKAGLYDMVMLDSVLNATSSDEYHEWVLRTCAALLADDGFLCLGTRAIETEQAAMSMRRSSGHRLQMTYMDDTGRAINIRRGTIYTMKFHSPLTLVGELSRFFGEVSYIGQEGATHTAVCAKPLPQRRSELTRALTEEFNPPYPPMGDSDEPYKHGRHGRTVETLLAANEAAGRILEDEA
jgi:ParB family chromosome partitioning protein